MLRIDRKGNVFEIKALAIADSYMITCPVVRVDKIRCVREKLKLGRM